MTSVSVEVRGGFPRFGSALPPIPTLHSKPVPHLQDSAQEQLLPETRLLSYWHSHHLCISLEPSIHQARHRPARWSHYYPIPQIGKMRIREMEKLTQNHTASAALGERHFCLSFIPHPDSPFPEERNCCPQSSQHRAGRRKSAVTIHQIELTRMLAIGTKLRMSVPTRGPRPNPPSKGTTPSSLSED